MNTISGGVAIGPSQIASGIDTPGESRNLPGILQKDLGQPHWMAQRTIPETWRNTRPSHVGPVGLVEIDSVPTRRETDLGLDTLSAGGVEVETVAILHKKHERVGVRR